MAFNQRSLRAEWRGVDVVHDLHGVRIAHRYDGNIDTAPGHRQQVARRAGCRLRLRRVERQRSGFAPRHAHVHGDFAAILERRLDQSAQGLDPDAALVRQTLVVHVAYEAARAVAALLDLAAVRIDDAVTKIGGRGRRRFDDQDLVGADAEMPVGQRPPLGRRQIERLMDAIDHDEIIAEAMHLGELELHGTAFE